jgi:transcription elongation factor Elf1
MNDESDTDTVSKVKCRTCGHIWTTFKDTSNEGFLTCPKCGVHNKHTVKNTTTISDDKKIVR